MAPSPDPTLASLSPLNLTIVALYGEARGETVEGQIAVGNSFFNRLLTTKWGSTLPQVLLQWAQYSCLWPTLGGSNYTAVMDFAHRVEDPTHYLPSERQLRWIAEGLVGGRVIDNIHGATHYLTKKLWLTAPPQWAKGRPSCAEIGNHVFFRGSDL